MSDLEHPRGLARKVLMTVHQLSPNGGAVSFETVAQHLGPPVTGDQVLRSASYLHDGGFVTGVPLSGDGALLGYMFKRVTKAGYDELERPIADFAMPRTAGAAGAVTFAGNANIGQLSTGSHSAQELTLNITVGQVLEDLAREVEQKVADPEQKRSFLDFLAKLKVVPELMPFFRNGVEAIGALVGEGLS